MAHETVNITVVELLGDHRVAVAFDDGARRQRDLSPLLTGPVFDAIRSNPDRFAEIGIDPERGVLCWPNGVDVDAELLRYDDLWNEAVGQGPNVSDPRSSIAPDASPVSSTASSRSRTDAVT